MANNGVVPIEFPPSNLILLYRWVLALLEHFLTKGTVECVRYNIMVKQVMKEELLMLGSLI